MMWIDASFAVGWLLGTERAKLVPVRGVSLAMLAAQYAETQVFFRRRDVDPLQIKSELERVALRAASRTELMTAADLYVEARQMKSKASLADAVLASVARSRNGRIATFDDDFRFLGFMPLSPGLWGINE